MSRESPCESGTQVALTCRPCMITIILLCRTQHDATCAAVGPWPRGPAAGHQCQSCRRGLHSSWGQDASVCVQLHVPSASQLQPKMTGLHTAVSCTPQSSQPPGLLALHTARQVFCSQTTAAASCTKCPAVSRTPLTSTAGKVAAIRYATAVAAKLLADAAES